MSALDRIHSKVRNALVKDGWNISQDPYSFNFRGEFLSTDIGAERPLAAERLNDKIAVEVKSFLGRSPMREFETALGQYQTYRILLSAIESERKLYLAVSKQGFEKTFRRETVKYILRELPMSIIVVDVFLEEIVEWLH